MWIKICGTTNLEDARLSIEAGANALGFIFSSSPRGVNPETAAQIITQLPPEIEKIGVFVNTPLESLLEIARRAGLTGFQLHGDEDPEYVERLHGAATGLTVTKALSAAEIKSRYSDAIRMEGLVDRFLLDSGSLERRGGTGVTFDWLRVTDAVLRLQKVTPMIIAGGLDADNVAAAISLFHPFGVDAVSGVEREKGK